MFSIPKAASLPALVMASLQLMGAAAQAQPDAVAAPAALASRADPADPKASVPAAAYVSPLRGYQAFAEPQVAPWRETNEAVRQRGGWREYAREIGEPGKAGAPAARPAAPAASQPAAPAKPSHSGHSGHPMK